MTGARLRAGTGAFGRAATARLALYALCTLICLFLVAPTLLVLPMSFSGTAYLQFPPESWSLQWYAVFFESPVWRRAMLVSFQAGVMASVLATLIGTAAAYSISRRPELRLILYGLFIAPMVVPVILIAAGLFYIYARLGLNNTMTGLVLAHTLLALPYVVLTVGAALLSFDANQERAAVSLGATPLRAFATVTLPQIRFSVLSAALLAFLISLDDAVVALFVSGGHNATITRRMFNALRDQIDPTIAAISTCLIVLSLLLFASTRIARHREAAGRAHA